MGITELRLWVALGAVIILVAATLYRNRNLYKDLTTVGDIRPTQLRKWEDKDFVKVYQDFVLR